jgi:hypothetical protein
MKASEFNKLSNAVQLFAIRYELASTTAVREYIVHSALLKLSIEDFNDFRVITNCEVCACWFSDLAL